ncbi:hypothetical protein ACHWQZ_G006064 [Mnemiopsis leidyi]
MPDPETKKELFNKWKSRIRRNPEDITKNTVICSEHFSEDDFRQYDLENVNRSESVDRIWIRLKPDAVPNTDRTTGEKRAFPFSEEEPADYRKGRKRVRGDIAYIDQLVADNMTVLESSSIDTDSPLKTHNSPEHSGLVNYQPTENEMCDRYISVIVSADTDNDKGVQCSPPTSNSSTQAGMSTSEQPAVSYIATAEEEMAECLHLEDDEDSEICDEDSDEEYTPHAKLSDNGKAKVIRSTRMKSHGKENSKEYTISWVYVNIQHLLLLFSFCYKCGSRITEPVRTRFTGLALSIDYVCESCTTVNQYSTWNSSPRSNRQFLINVRASCSLMVSGLRFQSVQNYWHLMEFPALSGPRFQKLIKKWLFPAIFKMYSENKSSICSRLRAASKLGQKVILCGDAQFDSPGYSAKFCTYTLMTTETNEVVDFGLIQKGQFIGGLEHQAFLQVWLTIVEDEGIVVTDFVMDRQATIAKIITDKYPETEVSFDIWHMGKSLGKRLQAAGKTHKKIKLWHKSIDRHLWYCCCNCNGDPELLVQMFHSCLLHVTNCHNWETDVDALVKLEEIRQSISIKRPYPQKLTTIKKCRHPHITKGENRAIPWFNVEDEDFEALFKIVTATRFTNDLKRCCKFLHTGKLESFHSMKLLYLPKLQSFEMETMIILTMLAAYQNNLCVKGGNLLKTYVTAAYSRANKGYVLKNKNVYDNLSFKKALLVHIEQNVKDNVVLTYDLQETYIKREVPKTFHGQSAPSKEVLKAKNKSRM